MIRVKIANGGQQLTNAGGSSWYCPANDISFAFPRMLDMAIAMLEEFPSTPSWDLFYAQGGTEEMIKELFLFLSKFCKATEDLGNRDSLLELSTKLGYKELSPQARALLGSAMLNVVMSLYFNGCRSAMSNGTIVNKGELAVEKKGSKRSFFKRLFRPKIVR